MKKFTDYLTESKKTYEFKIGIAGELPEGFDNSLETALQKFGLVKVTAGKKTPIQERPLDFPQLENTEVTYWEAEVSYPTTTLALQEYLGHCCDVPRYNVIVRNPNEPQELYQEEKEDKEYEVLMTKEDMGGESAQENVGTGRVMDLLKELETARKERANDYIGDVPVGESKDIGDTENTKSVVGG